MLLRCGKGKVAKSGVKYNVCYTSEDFSKIAQ